MTSSLLFDLVEWIAKDERLYAEVMEAWRTSCPRLTIWEDAIENRYVERKAIPGRGVIVTVTERGLEFLADHRPPLELHDRNAANPYPIKLR